MDFTFGITTTEHTNQYIPTIIDSVKKLKIPNFEVIIVGKYNFKDENFVKTIEFDESIKQNWTTRKKNIITENAKYNNIVYMHDYHVFDNNWYEGYLKFGNDFKVCSNVILNNGQRYRDWLWHSSKELPKDSLPNHEHLLPYFENRCSKWMYINGSYWVAKKEIMKEIPLNEELTWGQSEDIEWSRRISEKYNFSFNLNSSVTMLKFHCFEYYPMSNNTYNNYIVPFLKSKGL